MSRLLDDGPPVEVITDEENVITAATRMPRHLLRYWIGPKGSARVGGWGNPGSFEACQREMRKEGVPARQIDGLCAQLHHEATGKWPGEKHALTAAVNLAEDDDCPEGFHKMPDGDCMADEEMPQYAAWQGILTVEGVESGDGRMFQYGSLDWDTPPLPLMYQPANVGGHNGSVLVGQIQSIFRKGNQIFATGIIDLAARYAGEVIGTEVLRLMEEQFMNGVSVDVDKVKDADVELRFADNAGPMDKPVMTVFQRGRIRGATLVAFPAFVEAKIKLTGEMLTASAVGEVLVMQEEADCDYTLTASARTSGWSALPINTEREWDKNAAVRALVSWAGDDISGKYARAFLYKDGDGDPDLQGSYKFPIAEPIDGKLTIIAAAVRAAAARLSNADIPAEDKDTIRGTIDSIMNRVHEKTGVMTAASHTITIPDLPPAWWFSEPTDVELKGALTITDEGRVYGLLAPANTTHRSVNRKVPTRTVDYSRWMKGETITEGGERVVTGVITFDCGHAETDPLKYGTLDNRVQHYDNSCSVFADARVGETPEGAVWVAGAVKHYATADQISKAMSCTLSGDWQPHRDRPGVSEFIAALLVPVPGFAMARKEASVSFEDGALVASAVPVEFTKTTLLTAAARKKIIFAKRIGRDPESRKLELAKRLERTGQDV